jgi:Cu(I)/Ag(I) efflux system membrane fusion protein
MSTIKALVIGGVAGGIMTALAFTFLIPSSSSTANNEQNEEKQPLYWVAPMDPNYRRDEPGKSPMGMDLIPVYEESSSGDAGPGTITIAPNVENNLGVRTAKVQRRALHVPIRTVGYVQYNEETLIHVHPRVEGWIETLHVKASGEYVKKGEPLYSLYSPELVNAQEELLLAMRRNNKDLIVAARSRLNALQVPEDVVETLTKTKNVQQTVTFSAPQTGFVDNLNIREGFFIKPGVTVMSIGALDEVWVDAEVFERQTAQIVEGLPVTMTLDFLPGKTWQGVVDYVYPTLEQSTRTLRVRLRFANQDYTLKPNMFAQVTIHSDMDSTNLIVPTEAVIRTGNQNRVVLALGDGKFKSVAIKIGRVVDEFTEVLEGLIDGDSIVTSAQFMLDSESSISSDFKRMEPPEESPTSVFTEVMITDVMPSHNMITAKHGPIPEWDWPSMTMDFVVAEHINLATVKGGSSAHIEISKQTDGQYVVTTVHIIDSAQSTQATMSESVWTEVKINSVMDGHRMINVDHPAIKEWDWPAMTMDFNVADNITLSDLASGTLAHIEISKSSSGEYLVSTIHVVEEASSETSTAVDAVWTQATVNAVMSANNQLSLEHDPIEAWDWPAMTMDFNVANEVDLSDITAGMRLHIEITKTQDGAYVITTVHIQASDKGTMDNSQHEGAHE